MSITFQRNGRWVELKEFSNEEVSRYLAETLNDATVQFREVANLKFGASIMAQYDDVHFLICAKETWIEIAFDGNDREKMSRAIETITKWDKFSETEPTFYVEIEEQKED